MEYLAVIGITALSDGTVAVYGTERDGTVGLYGRENKQYKLKRFSLEMRRELGSARLTEVPCGMTEVQLGGRSTVAVSYA